MLYRHIPDSLNRSLALYITALILWVIANLFPFLGMKVGGIYHENLLFAAGWALYQNGMGELGLVVFLTSIVFPLITILSMIYLLLPVRLGIAPPQAGRVFQLVRTLEPWNPGVLEPWILEPCKCVCGESVCLIVVVVASLLVVAEVVGDVVVVEVIGSRC